MFFGGGVNPVFRKTAFISNLSTKRAEDWVHHGPPERYQQLPEETSAINDFSIIGIRNVRARYKMERSAS